MFHILNGFVVTMADFKEMKKLVTEDLDKVVKKCVVNLGALKNTFKDRHRVSDPAGLHEFCKFALERLVPSNLRHLLFKAPQTGFGSKTFAVKLFEAVEREFRLIYNIQ